VHYTTATKNGNSYNFGAGLDFDYTTVDPLDCLNIAFTHLHKKIRFQTCSTVATNNLSQAVSCASYCQIVSTKEFWTVETNLRRSSVLRAELVRKQRKEA
jgi:hypothetical protein